jgi:hypothetical protein
MRLEVGNGQTGIEIWDLLESTAFRNRGPHARELQLHLDCLRRVARLLASSPDHTLQELVDVATALCHADSAGVSIEDNDADGNPVFHWVATSGEYSKFLHAMLPRVWMPCQVCLATMRPQLVRVPKTHFDAMGVEGVAPITDGMLLPWSAGGVRGTIWILAHGTTEAFDHFDYLIMETLADFASMAVRNEMQQRALIDNAGSSAVASMAHELAHKINNPLQSISNSLYLATCAAPNEHVRQASEDLKRLSGVVQKLLDVSSRFHKTSVRVEPEVDQEPRDQ